MKLILLASLWLFPIATEDYVRISSPFGYSVSPMLGVRQSHRGIDIWAVRYAQIIAVADGMVIDHWPPPDSRFRGHPYYGGVIKIQHDNGLVSVYAHLSASYVREGQYISAGQVIGRMGNTGQVVGRNGGHHLHFEIRHGEKALNPLLYIRDPEGVTHSP